MNKLAYIKGIVWHFLENAYSLSCQKLDEKIYATHTRRVNHVDQLR